MALRLISCSCDRALLPPSFHGYVLSKPGWADLNSANLTPASGCQDHTTSPYAAIVSRPRAVDRSQAHHPPCDPVARKTLPRPPHPHPASVTIAIRPCCGVGWREVVEMICPTGEAKYFCKGDSTGFSTARPSGKSLGNPVSRSDANTNMSESFAYDGLNRLTSATVNLTPTPLAKTFSYSPIGNLLSKSDVGTYSYPAAGSPQPHAVMSVSGGLISTAFSYDPNGNQTAGLGRSIAYSSYNKPSSITQGTRTVSFLDDTEHQRFKQATPEGSTLYISAFGVLAELQNPAAAGQKWTDYLSAGNAKVGMRSLQTASETLTMRYFHTDHLGSISVLSNENGVVVERLSFDAWGKRRNPDGTADVTGRGPRAPQPPRLRSFAG